MFDLRWIRENPDAFAEGLNRRHLNGAELRDEILRLDEARREVLSRLQDLQARRNEASKAIGKAKASGDETAAQRVIDEVAKLKADAQAAEDEARTAEEAVNAVLAGIPNIPLAEVPDGKDENHNPVHHTHGEAPELAFPPKEHFDIGEALGLMDFETAAKLSGARFVVLKGPLARLERALGQFMLDLHTDEHGYTEIDPPLLVRDEVMFGTAQLPKFEEDQFKAISQEEIGADEVEVRPSDRPGVLSYNFKGPRADELARRFGLSQTIRIDRPMVDAGGRLTNIWPIIQSDRWLIPTAEVPLTNLVRESILDADSLPRRFTAHTPSFRAEAGAAGRDTRGMIRQHQFHKVELVSITKPEDSLAELDRMLGCAEEVLKRLGLHYRVVTLCTGDMGFASQKTYDIEVWLPGQGAYREISSCSVCGEFQARRMNARYRPEGEKGTRFVHTLNGSGVAVGRALIAILENYQQEDGSVRVPDALRPYMGGLEFIEAAGAQS